MSTSYGRFLNFLALSSDLDPIANPADAITPIVRDYVADLQHFGNKPGTIHVRLQHLREMAKLFDPQRDWRLSLAGWPECTRCSSAATRFLKAAS